MVGVYNRLRGVKCEVGTCFTDAAFTEFITVIPNDPALKSERHNIDVVLCRHHDEQFQAIGLDGIMTAHGDTITETVR